ncbi:ribosome biogenesis GTP-binding protein YihA/YsxC [Robertmurraya korlensis]|uniref:ribosome biogenesis GTP-binding protein YihA/YsxC n=1 Tax=Robertmurraya korlensis TaxID=519977 RepID=UPI002040E3F7|nr:ribosome biogenesis GTP-binding protein YihA/YsxC [Robertmurraya korlensis]MCM3599338.1 ribosome biogenesis GTP-binding protein YihA/YsxC [Robertmurraya korlensis]
MKVTSSEIVISAVKPDQYPVEPIPEFALAGRSNVGKSSFINKMLNRKGLARISSKPGKTQTLNFYIVNEVLHFVDVPGYGYAKVSKKEREAWGKMLETYLTTREQLKAVLLIVDLRHPPTADDIMMYDFLKHYEIPCIVIATKADKISKTKRAQHLKITKEKLELHPHDTIIQFSSETGEGKDKAWATIESYM